MESIEAAVFDELQHVAAVRGLALPALVRRQRLIDELGLRSLDLAHVVAALDRRLRVDPFLRHVPITKIATVGDLCDAYSIALRDAA
ncbi:MAG: hypothetical protein JNM18_03790 [Planctomycetaceae bacterium]|nr:hypothetical protein [Planctomycetaceae bacterium]